METAKRKICDFGHDPESLLQYGQKVLSGSRIILRLSLVFVAAFGSTSAFSQTREIDPKFHGKYTLVSRSCDNAPFDISVGANSFVFDDVSCSIHARVLGGTGKPWSTSLYNLNCRSDSTIPRLLKVGPIQIDPDHWMLIEENGEPYLLQVVGDTKKWFKQCPTTVERLADASTNQPNKRRPEQELDCDGDLTVVEKISCVEAELAEVQSELDKVGAVKSTQKIDNASKNQVGATSAVTPTQEPLASGVCEFNWKDSEEKTKTQCVRQRVCSLLPGSDKPSCEFVFRRSVDSPAILKVKEEEEKYFVDGIVEASRSVRGDAECFVTNDGEFSACMESDDFPTQAQRQTSTQNSNRVPAKKTQSSQQESVSARVDQQISSHTHNLGTLPWGSRAGMVVTVTQKIGMDTSEATIYTEHNAANAKAFCIGYSEDNSEECVASQLEHVRALKLKDSVSADCTKGTFTDLYGQAYSFHGRNNTSDPSDPEYILKQSGGGFLGADSASGYYRLLEIFGRLCPNTLAAFERKQTRSALQSPGYNQTETNTLVALNDVGSISEAQTHLYDLGWDVGDIDGVSGKKTRGVIEAFQRQINMAVTGDVTPELLNILRASEKPKMWGAVAFKAGGQYGASWRHTSRREAENDAVNRCLQQPGRRSNDCRKSVASTFGSNCIGLAFYQKGRRSGTTGSFGENASQARANTLIRCKEDGSRCKMVGLFCADGSHE